MIFIGLKSHIEENEMEQDVFLFYHCPLSHCLTSLINSASTVINEDIKLLLEGKRGNIQINDKLREAFRMEGTLESMPENKKVEKNSATKKKGNFPLISSEWKDD